MKEGFTLAETLITLGIIGVVATLTLPNLMSNYKNKVYIAQLQKVYNQLSNAAAQLMVDEDVDNLADTYLSDNPGRFLKKYFKVTKDCGEPTDWKSECFAQEYMSLDKSKKSSGAIYSNSYCVSVNTGASICMTQMYNDERYSYPDGSTDLSHGYSLVTVDTNGKNSPNIGGRDLFTFSLFTNGRIGESYEVNDNATKCEDAASHVHGASYGAGCFTKILEDGWKMDY